MASTILLKRSNTAGNDGYTGQLGEVTIDTQARKLRVHDGVQAGGYVVANMSDLQQLLTDLDIADVNGLQAALDELVNKDGSVAFTGNVDIGNNKIINVSDPTASTDGANKRYVDNEIAALGNVFSYEGSIAGGSQSTPFDLTTLSTTDAGSYYSVTAAGYVSDGVTTEYVNINDAVLFDSNGGYRVIDNTNSEISGTVDFISVSGSPDTGYTVDLDQTLKNRISDLETSNVQSVSGTAPITVDNSDEQNPTIDINNATQANDGAMSASDKTKLDGIAAGAQVNTVDTVNGQTGTVVLTKSDVGLSNVDNYATANQAQATAGSANNLFMTPEGVRFFVEDGTYTIDGGTF